MTKRSTIETLNAKISDLTDKVNQSAFANSEVVHTIRRRLSTLLGLSHDGKRSLYQIYGYEQELGGTAGFQIMYRMSRREGISNRVTWGIAKTCWRDGFEVYESADDQADEIMVDELTALNKAGLNAKLEAADILNRIGRFSVLFVGVPDGRKPSEPIGTVSGNADDVLDQLYFVPYAYDGITISKQIDDITDPRFGEPELYQLQRISRGDDEKDKTSVSVIVHWSRIIHLNENALDSTVEGMGALEPVWNRLLDIDKATGGASEAYFRNAKGKIAYEVGDKFAASLQDDEVKAKFQDGVEKYTNEFQDHTIVQGTTVKTLPTPHATPLDTVKVALWGIAAYTGYPLRVLTGEGSGQLAGSEDQLAVNQITRDRQRQVLTPWVVRFFDILQSAGMLKALPEDYEVRFPVQEAATEKQKADNGSAKAGTVLKLVQAKSMPGGDGLDLEDAFAACGLEDIEVEEPEIDDTVIDKLDPNADPDNE